MDPAVALDDPDGFGGAKLKVGSAAYTTAASTFGSGSIFDITRVAGPAVTGSNGLTMVPVWMWLRVDTSLPDLLAASANPETWRNATLFLSFRPEGYEATCAWPCSQGMMAVSSLELVSVPTPATLPIACVGVACGWLVRRRQR